MQVKSFKSNDRKNDFDNSMPGNLTKSGTPISAIDALGMLDDVPQDR